LFFFFLKKTSQGWKEVMIDWNPLTKKLQYVLSLKPTPMIRIYENVYIENNLKKKIYLINFYLVFK
jgi:hypothetical protein